MDNPLKRTLDAPPLPLDLLRKIIIENAATLTLRDLHSFINGFASRAHRTAPELWELVFRLKVESKYIPLSEWKTWVEHASSVAVDYAALLVAFAYRRFLGSRTQPSRYFKPPDDEPMEDWLMTQRGESPEHHGQLVTATSATTNDAIMLAGRENYAQFILFFKQTPGVPIPNVVRRFTAELTKVMDSSYLPDAYTEQLYAAYVVDTTTRTYDENYKSYRAALAEVNIYRIDRTTLVRFIYALIVEKQQQWQLSPQAAPCAVCARISEVACEHCGVVYCGVGCQASQH